MDSQITEGSSEDAIGENAIIPSASSGFALPFRVPVQPNHTASGSSDLKNTQNENFERVEGGFKASIINKYRVTRLGSTIWQCKICGKKATDIIHAATSTLSALGSATSDAVIPVCNSTNCVTQGQAMAEGLSKKDSASSAAMTCENCGNLSKMTLCAACRFTQTARNSPCVKIRGPPRQRRRNRGKEDVGISGSRTQL